MGELRASISGFRGIVGDSLNASLVLRLAASYASLLGSGPVILGRDTRPSGEALARAAQAGILSVGRDVHYAGIVPTPTVGLYAKSVGAAGGIVVTASHNPVEWNALKFFGPDGLFVPESMILAIQERESTDVIPWCSATQTGKLIEDTPALDTHLQRVVNAIDASLTRKSALKVVVDGCNGAGSVLLPLLLRKIGCEVVELDCVPDGNFTRPLEPTAAALISLSEVVKREKAAVGFAIDPDADRLALVDDTGQALSEEMTLVLAADYVLAKKKGPLVANLSSTGLLDRVAAKHGVPMERTKIGEMHVAGRILALNSPIGGEGNGGVIVPSIHPGRDAATGAALLIERLAKEGRPLSSIVAEYPPVAMVKDKVSVAGLDVKSLLDKMKRAYPDARANDLDGLRMDWPDRWLHVRASNTEPIVRLIAEGPDEASAKGLVEEFRRKVMGS